MDDSHTTTQQRGSLLKSARDIMRKDKGLSGDLTRLPMLTWVMFLKYAQRAGFRLDMNEVYGRWHSDTDPLTKEKWLSARG